MFRACLRSEHPIFLCDDARFRRCFACSIFTLSSVLLFVVVLDGPSDALQHTAWRCKQCTSARRQEPDSKGNKRRQMARVATSGKKDQLALCYFATHFHSVQLFAIHFHSVPLCAALCHLATLCCSVPLIPLYRVAVSGRWQWVEMSDSEWHRVAQSGTVGEQLNLPAQTTAPCSNSCEVSTGLAGVGKWRHFWRKQWQRVTRSGMSSTKWKWVAQNGTHRVT